MKALVQRISKCLLRLTPGEASRALLFCCCHDGVTANWGDGHWCAVDGAFACLLCCDGCDVAKKRLALDGMTNGLPIKMLATSLILLNVLVLGMTVRYSAVFEGQHRPHYPISGGTSTSSSCFTRVGPIQTKSVSRVLELHVRWKRHTATGTGSFFWATWKEICAAYRRSIRSATGLLDRALDDLVDFREMHGFHTWPLPPHDPRMPHMGQLAKDLRSSCLRRLLQSCDTREKK